MEKLYIFSELSLWENDIMYGKEENEPSPDVINAIIDYSLIKEFYSPTLNKNIAIGIN